MTTFFCIKSGENFANLPLMGNAPGENNFLKDVKICSTKFNLITALCA